MGERSKVNAAQASVPPEEASDLTEQLKQDRVLVFYSDREGKKWREFSNFYRHPMPFEFRLPAFARLEGSPSSVWCDFSEKAIMLTKAALMGDPESFQAIAGAPDPKSCKALGRGVQGFNQELWDRHLEEVAFEVVRQKFASSRGLRELLLSTGDAILAEAAPNDAIWGIGLGIHDERARDPSAWLGRNVLGYALMRAREHLRGDAAAHTGAAGSAAAGSDTAGTAGGGLTSCGAEAGQAPEAAARTAGSEGGAGEAAAAAGVQAASAPGRRRKGRGGGQQPDAARARIAEAPSAAAPVPVFESLVVLDFEATCDHVSQPQPQEIIEFPMVLVDGRTGKAVDEFRTYVRPRHHPQLTHFCTELTGIQQSSVDGAPEWPVALSQAQAWLDAALGERGWQSCCFVTCGDWDLRKMMPQQCATSGMHVPERFRRWVNIKELFRRANGKRGGSMVAMLGELSLTLEGRHHCGLDDCRNIARILARLLELGGPIGEDAARGR